MFPQKTNSANPHPPYDIITLSVGGAPTVVVFVSCSFHVELLSQLRTVASAAVLFWCRELFGIFILWYLREFYAGTVSFCLKGINVFQNGF